MCLRNKWIKFRSYRICSLFLMGKYIKRIMLCMRLEELKRKKEFVGLTRQLPMIKWKKLFLKINGLVLERLSKRVVFVWNCWTFDKNRTVEILPGTCWTKSLAIQFTNHGSIIMTSKHRSNCSNGSTLKSRDQKSLQVRSISTVFLCYNDVHFHH